MCTFGVWRRYVVCAGEGGYVPAPVEFMRSVREYCDKHDILMIADEVQSGQCPALPCLPVVLLFHFCMPVRIIIYFRSVLALQHMLTWCGAPCLSFVLCTW